MVQRQQPRPERLQDKADGHGLQEGEAEEPSHSSQDVWDSGGESRQLQVTSVCTSLRT